ncbi:MAG TPA: hypothetical protein VMG14_01040 [Thermoplasmata archaeon]|nr:hypothetical protein [Thermoplasmata archaeon]
MASTGAKIAAAVGLATGGIAALAWWLSQAPPPSGSCPTGETECGGGVCCPGTDVCETGGTCPDGYAPDPDNAGCCAPSSPETYEVIVPSDEAVLIDGLPEPASGYFTLTAGTHTLEYPDEVGACGAGVGGCWEVESDELFVADATDPTTVLTVQGGGTIFWSCGGQGSGYCAPPPP